MKAGFIGLGRKELDGSSLAQIPVENAGLE